MEKTKNSNKFQTKQVFLPVEQLFSVLALASTATAGEARMFPLTFTRKLRCELEFLVPRSNLPSRSQCSLLKLQKPVLAFLRTLFSL